jgi:hypothetical protein
LQYAVNAYLLAFVGMVNEDPHRLKSLAIPGGAVVRILSGCASTLTVALPAAEGLT